MRPERWNWMIFDQHEFDIRCEWGKHGVSLLAPISDAVVVVDVISFTTSVDIAVSRGAKVYPYSWRDETAAAYAESVGALLADPRWKAGSFSLSAESLLEIPGGAKIVIPSPNGSTLSLAARPTPTLAGCLRNARAVAAAAGKFGAKIAVIPAGERWSDDQRLRPSFEDLVGAGAIISRLPGCRSPEAQVAAAAFEAVQADLEQALLQCPSGKELIERGYGNDVLLAAKLNISDCAPILVDGVYYDRAG